MSKYPRIDRSLLFSALCASFLLQGCAVPGFGGIGRKFFEPDGPQEKEHILGYRPVVETAPASVGDAPEGAIFPISPTLIKEKIAEISTPIPNEIRSLFGVAPSYSIGPGDVVGVIVYDHPELLPNSGAVISQQADPTGVGVAPGFIVSATGEISFPYVGRVKLQGLTEIEASDLISLRIAKYIRDPQVTVRIQSFRSQRAYVEGEVRTPGMQIFTDVPMTLTEAINRAGGIASTGDRSFITLSRDGRTYRLDLQTLQEQGADGTKIPLKNGDIISVKNRDESKVYVMGEIARPSALLMRNGRLSLNEALGDAGGPNLTTANTGQIYVIRNGDGVEKNPLIYHLDAKNPIALALADKFPLRARDVVYVDSVPLVLWNRLVSLILPSAQVVNLGSEAAAR